MEYNDISCSIDSCNTSEEEIFVEVLCYIQH